MENAKYQLAIELEGLESLGCNLLASAIINLPDDVDPAEMHKKISNSKISVASITLQKSTQLISN